MKIFTLISLLAALTISGLGGFFFYRYGVAKYDQGYLQCQAEGTVLATEAGKQLNETIHKYIKPTDVVDKLHINNWLRDAGDL